MNSDSYAFLRLINRLFMKKSINSTVLDFIEGRIASKDFIVLYYENNEIFDWIQSIVSKRKNVIKT